jgi:hypothetical protein
MRVAGKLVLPQALDRMRVSSPTTLLLGVVLLCVATALAGVWMAISPPWLGGSFQARPDGAVVAAKQGVRTGVLVMEAY